MQNDYTIQAMDGSATELHLSAEEKVLFEGMVDDSFLDAAVSFENMRTAIAQYASRNWQA